MKMLEFQNYNYKKNKIHRNPYENNETHENHIIVFNENHRIPWENHENHENHGIPLENQEKNWKS